MTDCDALVKALRMNVKYGQAENALLNASVAADAIEELLKAARAMHTWIFLHTGDEEAAY